jgi:hypothetical protein
MFFACIGKDVLNNVQSHQNDAIVMDNIIENSQPNPIVINPYFIGLWFHAD